MPTLIEWREGKAVLVDDAFSYAADDDQYLPSGDVILSLARFQSDGDRLISEGRRVGVRLTTWRASAMASCMRPARKNAVAR